MAVSLKKKKKKKSKQEFFSKSASTQGTSKVQAILQCKHQIKNCSVQGSSTEISFWQFTADASWLILIAYGVGHYSQLHIVQPLQHLDLAIINNNIQFSHRSLWNWPLLTTAYSSATVQSLELAIIHNYIQFSHCTLWSWPLLTTTHISATVAFGTGHYSQPHTVQPLCSLWSWPLLNSQLHTVQPLCSLWSQPLFTTTYSSATVAFGAGHYSNHIQFSHCSLWSQPLLITTYSSAAVQPLELVIYLQPHTVQSLQPLELAIIHNHVHHSQPHKLLKEAIIHNHIQFSLCSL